MCPWHFKAAGDGQEEGLASIERPHRSRRPLSRPNFLRDHVAPPSEFSVPPGNYFPAKVRRREGLSFCSGRECLALGLLWNVNPSWSISTSFQLPFQKRNLFPFLVHSINI